MKAQSWIFLCLASSVLCLTPSVIPIEPKTIHISSTVGGISHIAWTLEIGKVLAERGHRVSFLTTDIYVKHGVPYQPHVQTISLGPHNSKVEFRDLFDTDQPMSKKVTDAYQQVIRDTYKRDYLEYLRIFNESNTDMVICDQMSLACFDAAKKLNIVMVIHMTMSLSYGKEREKVRN
jgi:UDP-N-acetylglucosamine:LPS N-acetylglucosamine transferase